jgi:hypothetical protein
MRLLPAPNLMLARDSNSTTTAARMPPRSPETATCAPEPITRFPRSAAMTIDKRQIAEALAKHHVRTACALVDLAVLVFDLFDVQPPAVMEAIIEETERRQTTGPPTRRVLRDAVLQYAGERMREAREREWKLYHGITGE